MSHETITTSKEFSLSLQCILETDQSAERNKFIEPFLL